jgi:uncharacterized protein with HEPN domain
MQLEIKSWLYDILNAIIEIESFVGINEDFSRFQGEIKTKRAVERNIEIIGEAMNRILMCGDTIKLSDSRKIVDTRNRIIHGYDSVSDEILWNIIREHLPKLKEDIQSLLQE